jgi:hypothetical protein
MQIVFEIWSRSQGRKVGEASTRKGAYRSVIRRDNVYGAYDHYVKEAARPVSKARAAEIGLTA